MCHYLFLFLTDTFLLTLVLKTHLLLKLLLQRKLLYVITNNVIYELDYVINLAILQPATQRGYLASVITRFIVIK